MLRRVRPVGQLGTARASWPPNTLHGIMELHAAVLTSLSGGRTMARARSAASHLALRAVGPAVRQARSYSWLKVTCER